jgi:hypothetical protein
MASRLFRAVVGVGIALGTSGVACFGAADDPAVSTDASSPEASSTSGRDSASSTEDAALDVDVRADAGADAALDAPVDAPKDVILDAFCDASWPTTKGNPGGPTCGEITDCADAGPSLRCINTVSPPATCEATATLVPVWCVASQWQCSEGAIPQDECKCWEGLPCP